MGPPGLRDPRNYAIDGEFYLAHRADAAGDIEVSVSRGTTLVNSSLTGPQEIYVDPPSAEEAGWIDDVVEQVAAILAQRT
jgi:hypothetical protein